MELYSVSINGGQVKQISAFEGREGVYSPKGDLIAYVRGLYQRYGYDEVITPQVMDGIPETVRPACVVAQRVLSDISDFIQPGVTTVDEALTRLEASAWTSAIDNRTINNVSGFISWTWSDQKPDWINANIDGKIWATQKRIVSIIIYGDLQLGNTRLTLGLPDQEVIDRAADRKGEFSLYTATYGQNGLLIQSWQPCRVLEPLRRPVILIYTLSANPNLFPARDSLMDLYHTCAFHRP
jgi:hypothetical protein